MSSLTYKFVRVLEYSGIGHWIFTRRVMWWSFDESITRQLPLWARLFCVYCRVYLRVVPFETILVARLVYRLLRRIDAAFRVAAPHLVTVGSSRLFFRLDDPSALWAISELVGQSPMRAAFEKLLQPDTIVVDVGANCGMFSVFALFRNGRRAPVISIEPQPNLCACMRLSREANSASDWLIHQCAAGAINEPGTVQIPTENSGEAVICTASQVSACDGVPIEIRSLDDILRDLDCGTPCVLKLDIEGSEFEAIAGAREFITRVRPTLFLEINPIAAKRNGHSIEALRDALLDLGYRTWSDPGDCTPRSLLEIPTSEFLDVIVWHD